MKWKTGSVRKEATSSTWSRREAYLVQSVERDEGAGVPSARREVRCEVQHAHSTVALQESAEVLGAQACSSTSEAGEEEQIAVLYATHPGQTSSHCTHGAFFQPLRSAAEQPPCLSSTWERISHRYRTPRSKQGRKVQLLTYGGGDQGLVDGVVRDDKDGLGRGGQHLFPAKSGPGPELSHGVVPVNLKVGSVRLPHAVLSPVPLLPLLLEESLRESK